jgi:hypothetical protein
MLKRLLTTAVLVASAAAAAVAQTGEAQEPARGRANRQPTAALNAVEVVRMLDGWTIMEAQKALALSDEQYAQFVVRLRRLQEARRQNQRERNRLLQELRRMAGPQAAAAPDDTVLRDRLKALRDLDDRAHAEARQAYDALDEVLDARQQARFRMFEEMIERRKLDLLVRARERAARGGRDGGGD